MKKFLALLLAVMMIASMSITAFAAGASTVNGEGAISGNTSGVVKVNSSENEGEDIEKVYYVTIEWQELNFVFTFNNAAAIEWDPMSHAYVDKSGENAEELSGTWTSKQIAEAITVTNHSNDGVSVTALFGTQNTATANDVTATVEVQEGEESLDNGEGYSFDDADHVVYTVYIGDKADISNLTTDVPSYIDGFEIGTITVTVSTT